MVGRRELSVHVEHETLLKLEAAGLTDALAQRIIQSKGNQLAKEVVHLLEAEVPGLIWQEAQNIMGEKHFFGPEEWATHFGQRGDTLVIPDVPWGEEELGNLGEEEHFLFLGLPVTGGMRLDLDGWQWLLQKLSAHPRFSSTALFGFPFAMKSCSLRWYLMPTSIFREVPEGYENPTCVERVTANILFFLQNGRYLDEGWSAYVSDEVGSHAYLLVTAFPDRGLHIQQCAGDHFLSDWGTPKPAGKAASRRLPR